MSRPRLRVPTPVYRRFDASSFGGRDDSCGLRRPPQPKAEKAALPTQIRVQPSRMVNEHLLCRRDRAWKSSRAEHRLETNRGIMDGERRRRGETRPARMQTYLRPELLTRRPAGGRSVGC